MERWGIQKYNRSASQKVISNSGGSLTDKNIFQVGEKSHESPSRSGAAKRPLGGKPEVPPKKREKLSHFVAERAYDDLAIAFEEISPPSSEDLTKLGNNSSQSLATPTALAEPAKNRGGQDDIHVMDRAVDDTVMNNLLELEQIHLHDDFLEFNLDDFNDVKAMADFAYAAQLRFDSFNLYTILLQRLNVLKDAPLFIENGSQFCQRMTSMAIVGCARSATTASQLEISINLLERQISQWPPYAGDTAEMFLCRSLLEQAYRQHGRIGEADFQHRLASQLTCVQEGSLSPKPNQAVSLLNYFYLDHALSRGEFTTSHNLKAELISASPGLFQYHSGRMQNKSVRDCLEWCIWKLENFSPSGWHEPWTMSFPGANFIDLFYNLWPGWRQRMMHTFSPRDLSQAGQMEKDSGLSPTEFLAVICVMIMKEHSLIPPVVLASVGGSLNMSNITWDADILRVKSLLRRSDWALANSFLKAYSDTNREYYSRDLLSGYKARRNLKEYFKIKVGGLELPQLPELDELELESYLRSRSEAPYSETNLVGLFTTLSPSIHSETLSSFRALKDRIETGAVECMNAVADANLPSSMMRHTASARSLDIFAKNSTRGDSQSLLSATSSSNMQFSALDALASVSACVRNRVSDVESRISEIRQSSLPS